MTAVVHVHVTSKPAREHIRTHIHMHMHYMTAKSKNGMSLVNAHPHTDATYRVGAKVAGTGRDSWLSDLLDLRGLSRTAGGKSGPALPEHARTGGWID